MDNRMLRCHYSPGKCCEGGKLKCAWRDEYCSIYAALREAREEVARLQAVIDELAETHQDL